MKTKTFEELLTRKSTKQELKDLIEMAEAEIFEWRPFIVKCKEKLTLPPRQLNKVVVDLRKLLIKKKEYERKSNKNKVYKL